MSIRLTFSALVLLIQTVGALPSPLILEHPCDLLRGETVKVTIPSAPVSDDAVSILSTNNHQRFKQWKKREHEESFYLIQTVAACWKDKGYTEDYLVYGKTTPNLKSERFSWDVIPYPTNGWSDLKQISVIWNVSFGVDSISEKERKRLATSTSKNFERPLPHLQESHPEKSANDPFCDQKVLDRQTIIKGDKVSLIYDQAPMRVGTEMPHFLIVTNAHKTHFEELSPDEYLEAMQMTNKVVNYFQHTHPKSTLYFMHKKGRRAGQTVPHWHMHIVVKEEDASVASFQFPCLKSPTSCTSLSSPFKLMKNKFARCGQSCLSFFSLLLPNEKLSDEDLETRVRFYKKQFNELTTYQENQ